MIYAYAIIAVLFATARVSGLMVSPALSPLVAASFKDLAHLFDGAMLVGGGLTGEEIVGRFVVKHRYVAMALGWTLAVVELATFVATKGTHSQ